ncbi:hypothetical protein IFM89_029793 [Coptis chinensis]|uniref:Peroxidase n=1 Tax=Coptis chinensis TaxID=261450 RepID=A0A835MAB9_9MAGN|nr:hypothetical protein IFM89_029793 [Coptis chinensis]
MGSGRVNRLKNKKSEGPFPCCHEFELNLDYDFCCDTCPQAEQIVRSMVRYKIPPAFLRLLVYDCFIQGCDASVLLASVDGIRSEKDTPPNDTLQGFNVIDMIKSKIEEVCPATVSCADILVLAATEGIAMAGGPYYHLYTGRRDSLMSFPEVGAYAYDDLYKTLTSFASRGFDERETVSILGNLTFLSYIVCARGSPYDDLYKTLTSFASRGFDERETVSILGNPIFCAHSIGIIHCQFFHNRLYNFAGSGGPDPSLEPVFLNQMRSRCSFLLLYCSMVSSEGL